MCLTLSEKQAPLELEEGQGIHYEKGEQEIGKGKVAWEAIDRGTLGKLSPYVQKSSTLENNEKHC